MIRSPGWRLPAMLATLFLIGVLAPATATAQPMPYGGRIVGHVTQNGAPVADTWVHVFDASTQQHYGRATTGADGSYVVDLLNPGDYKIQFVSSDFRRTQWAR